jgi:hypothetical protein
MCVPFLTWKIDVPAAVRLPAAAAGDDELTPLWLLNAAAATERPKCRQQKIWPSFGRGERRLAGGVAVD